MNEFKKEFPDSPTKSFVVAGGVQIKLLEKA